MTDSPETPAEGAARRRRWLTFGEIIAVVAVTISAASLWDSHQSRVAAEKPAPAAPTVRAAPLVLTASTDAEGRTLRFAAASRDQVIQTQTIIFPTALGTADIDTVGNPRLEAGWFADELHAAARDSSAARRLPVAVVTHYLDDGAARDDTAIYDIGYTWRSRFIRNDAPALEGITLVWRGAGNTRPDDIRKRLDARWTKAHPAKP